jgi:hypothetical protein
VSRSAAWLEAQAQGSKGKQGRHRQAKAAGIQVIEFKGGEGIAYRNKAYEAGWAGIINESNRREAEEFSPVLWRPLKVPLKPVWGSDSAHICRIRPRF